MARIAGVDLPRNKRIEIALTYIYGIGRTAALDDLRRRPRSIRTRKTRRADRRRGRRASARVIDANYKVEGDLRREVAHEHQAADGPRLLPRPAPPPRTCRCAASARTPTRAPARVRARRSPARRRRRRRARRGARTHGEDRAAKQAATGRTPTRRKKAKHARREGVAAHPVDVQQHDRHDHRPAGQRASPGRAPGQSASRARARARRSPRSSPPRRRRSKAMEHGMRTSQVYVKGPGAGRESALRALQAAGFKITHDPRRDADPAQRLPAAEAAPRLSRGAVRRWHVTRIRLPALPARRHEALPQGRALLHRQVRHRAPQLSARPARPGRAPKFSDYGDAAAREAEGASASTACSSGSSAATSRWRDRAQGRHRREPAAAARAAPRQRGLPARLRDLARRGAPARAPRPLHGQRPQGRTSRRTW